MPSIAHHAGGAQPRAPQGHPNPSHLPQPPPAPGLPVGATGLLANLARAALPRRGRPAPNPLPGLASKPRSDVCRPGCFSADFLSHALSALQAPVGTGEGGGTTAPRAMQRAACQLLAWLHPVPRCQGVVQPPDLGAEAALAPRWPPTMAAGPWLGGGRAGGSTCLGSPQSPQGHCPSPADCPLRCCPLCSTCGPGGQWQCEDHACLMDGELIDAINRGNYG